MTARNLTTNSRFSGAPGSPAFLTSLSRTLRHINCSTTPDEMIQTALCTMYDMSGASRVIFNAPGRRARVPAGAPDGPYRSSRSFPVPFVAPAATITIDFEINATLEPDILHAIQALAATLGSALARADRDPVPDRTVTLSAGNALSTALVEMHRPDEVRQSAVEWAGAYFDAEHCVLFNAALNPVQFPGVLPRTQAWTGPDAGPLPGPAELLSERALANGWFVTPIKVDSGDDVVFAVGRDARWSNAERDTATHLAGILKQHLNRATERSAATYRSRNLQAVQQITSVAAGAFDLAGLCALMRNAIRQLIPHDAFLIALRPAGAELVTAIYRAEGETVYPPRSATPQVVTAFELARPLVVDDIAEGAIAEADRFGDPEKCVRSLVSAPMMSQGAPIGMIVAQSYEPGFYNGESADLLQAIALSVAGAFERLMLLQQIERQTQRDIGLRSVAERLAETLDTDQLIAVASGVVFDTVPSDLVLILVIDRQTNRVRSASYRSVDTDFEPPAAGHVMREQSLTFTAIATASQIVEPDYEAGPYASPVRLPWHHAGSAVATPIAIDALHAGVILLARHEADGFATDDLSLMRQIAAMLSTALQNTIAHADRLRHTNDLMELQRISATIGSQLDLQRSLDEIVRAAPQLVQADSCAVGILDGPDLMRVAANGALAMAIPLRVPVERLLVHDALKSTQPIVMEDLRANPLEPGATALPIPDTRGWLGMPLIDPEGQAVGIMSLMTAEPRAWSERDRSLLATLASSATLAIQNARHFERTRDLLTASVESLAAAVEAKDSFTQNHSRQVAHYARRIAEALELDAETIGNIELAGLLHDVGKIGIPDSVLSKPGALDGAEWAAMQLHPLIGEQILAGNPILNPLLAMVRHHHERWDGHGYPDGLRGKQIPLGASVISLAEALDAMTSQRPYRAALTWEETLDEIRLCSGIQFAPPAVDALMQVIESGALDADIARLRATVPNEARVPQPRSQPLDVRALRIFDEVSQEIRAGTDLPTFISRIVSVLADVLDGSSVALYLVGDDSGELELMASQTKVDAASPQPVQSELHVPLTAEGQGIGVLHLELSRPGNFPEMDERLLESISGHLANALHVIRLHERIKTLATTDPLTGLNNHRAFFDRLVLEVERADENGTKLSIAILDVNNLKAVNDTYGHLTGDAALRAVADVLLRHRREEDVVCRYGGDEFALILSEADADTAFSVLDPITTELRSGEFEIDDVTFPLLTAAWGIATFPDDGRRPTELLSVADERMYLHKQTTRL